MATAPDNLAEAKTTPTVGWNHECVVVAIIVGFFMQNMVASRLCVMAEVESAKFLFALALDGLILLRLIVAKYLKQQDRGWIFYAILAYSSPAWIEPLSLVLNKMPLSTYYPPNRFLVPVFLMLTLATVVIFDLYKKGKMKKTALAGLLLAVVGFAYLSIIMFRS